MGLTAEGIDRIRAAAAAAVQDGAVPGLVVLVASGDDVHAEAFGRVAVGGAPMARDTIFRIASVTKPIAGAAAMALLEEGLIRLDEPVDRLLPELAGPRVLRRLDGPLDDTVPAHRAITVRDLLTFTYGFGFAAEMFTAPEPWPVLQEEKRLRLSTLGPPDAGSQPAPDDWIAGIGSLPLLAQPGERWLYNTSASVLGVLLSRAAGAPLGEVFRSRLFDPLGMPDTGFGTDRADRLGPLYRPTADGLEVWDEPAGAYARRPPFEDAAGGLVATADDLLAFARMLLAGGGRVLRPESVAAMTSDQLTPDQRARGGMLPGFFDDRSWGYCQAVEDSGAYGWDGGFGTSWRVDPTRDLVTIVLTQVMWTSPEPPQLHKDIQAASACSKVPGPTGRHTGQDGPTGGAPNHGTGAGAAS